MRAVVEYFVAGVPAPKGTKKIVQPKGHKRPMLLEQSKRVKPWQREIVRALSGMLDKPLADPAHVAVVFILPRPKSHYGTGANATTLRDNAPAFPTHQRDVDKLCRSTLDGLVQAGVLADDDLVVRLSAEKRYADHWEPSGAFIEVRRVAA